jgi:hypothetical protein
MMAVASSQRLHFIGVHDRGEAVGDDEGRALPGEGMQGAHDLALGVGIEAAAGFVEEYASGE